MTDGGGGLCDQLCGGLLALPVVQGLAHKHERLRLAPAGPAGQMSRSSTAQRARAGLSAASRGHRVTAYCASPVSRPGPAYRSTQLPSPPLLHPSSPLAATPRFPLLFIPLLPLTPHIHTYTRPAGCPAAPAVPAPSLPPRRSSAGARPASVPPQRHPPASPQPAPPPPPPPPPLHRPPPPPLHPRPPPHRPAHSAHQPQHPARTPRRNTPTRQTRTPRDSCGPAHACGGGGGGGGGGGINGVCDWGGGRRIPAAAPAARPTKYAH